MLGKALLSASVSAPPAVYVEDVFSTWLYTGNNSTQTITNGIDLAGKGGMVWLKQRSTTGNHTIQDTVRGNRYQLIVQQTGSSNINSGPTVGVTAFTSSGFDLGTDYQGENPSGTTMCSWTFRKAAKFFDVVTWTGDGNNTKTITHSLGSIPGFIVGKPTSANGSWRVYHRSLSTSDPGLKLNTTDAGGNSPYDYGDSSTVTTPTSTQFTVGQNLNNNGVTFIAYLFAHDAGGFGTAGTDSVVKCGSYTGNGSTSGPTVTLGWEPQWLLIKRTDSAGYSWFLQDTMRQMSFTNTAYLVPDSSSAESLWGSALFNLSATGFQLNTSNPSFNASGGTYIYIAIRRGPMKTPTVGTTVFALNEGTGSTSGQSVTTNFPVDMDMTSYRTLGAVATVGDRMRGYGNTNTGGATPTLTTSSTAAESTGSNPYFYQAWNTTITRGSNGADPGGGIISYFFRRAPGFFDVVAATGTSTGKSDWPHALGVAPELIIRKSRTNAYNWQVWSANVSGNGVLSATSAWSSGSGLWKYDGVNTNMTATTFSTAASAEINSSGDNFITYLFASCPGVSKVGSYTGTGTTLSIDCGFTAGARLVLIKRTDSTGDWYVWDTARGIISGNDPYLLLNSAAAEVTNTDYIDPLSSGFQISSTAPAAINNNGGSFIFLAIA